MLSSAYCYQIELDPKWSHEAAPTVLNYNSGLKQEGVCLAIKGEFISMLVSLLQLKLV